MRYSEPTVKRALNGLLEIGCKRVIGCPMAPHASPASTEAYRKALLEATEAVEEPPEVALAEGWHASPSFLGAWAESVGEAWEALGDEERAGAIIIFTAHSLPVSVAAGSPYEAQIRETVEGVMARVPTPAWEFAWQSQGIRGGEWLMPDMPETLSKVAYEGYKTVVFVPVGFVADHVETLYDIDIEARRMTEDMGLVFHRAESLNDRPSFIEALAEAVLAEAENR
jgi:ferrochelatase